MLDPDEPQATDDLTRLLNAIESAAAMLDRIAANGMDWRIVDIQENLGKAKHLAGELRDAAETAEIFPE